jgi:hypothetical protein
MLSEPYLLSLIEQRSQQRRPVQVEALDHWADGSVRWTLLDFQATVAAGETAAYHLEFAPPTPSLEAPPVALLQSQDTWTVDTGVARFALNTHDPLHTAFRQKAEFFFQACIRDLTSFETCTLTRPLVLLITNAFRHTYFSNSRS